MEKNATHRPFPGWPLATALLLLSLAAFSCNLESNIRKETFVQGIELTPPVEFTATITDTPSAMPRPTPTDTATDTDTPTWEFSPTPTETPTNTPSSTRTPTSTRTMTYTRTPTYTRTVTPTRTPTFTRTVTSTRTATWVAPWVFVELQSFCNYGPGKAYLYHRTIPPNTTREVRGWTEILEQRRDGSWQPQLWVFNRPVGGGDDACWTHGSLMVETRRHITDATWFVSYLPRSSLYQPPEWASAARSGNMVRVTWAYVWMTEDDYRGYLVEARVCHQGKMYPAPVAWKGDNVENASVEIPDEAGCGEPSSAILYAVEKHGYTRPIEVSWPQP
jgi:hypothetical protein